MSCEAPVNGSAEPPVTIENDLSDQLQELESSDVPPAPSSEAAQSMEPEPEPKAAELPPTLIPRCLSRATRKPAYTSSLLTSADLAQEIIARAEKRRQSFPDAVDVLVAMKSSSGIRTAPIVSEQPPKSSQSKLPKLRDDDKSLDAKELLLILGDGDMGESKSKNSLKSTVRTPRAKLDLRIDPELERQLALKQLMEFSKGDRKKERNRNNNLDVTKIKKEPKDTKEPKGKVSDTKERKPKKRTGGASNGPLAKKGGNRELQRLLQDEGAINMLYDIRKGESGESKARLSSKKRLKKVLKKKAQEVEEAIMVATSSSTNSRSLRTSDKRKRSVESVEPEEPAPANQSSNQTAFNFQAPAEASKIIRRHSSSSSYSSRGSSPRRASVDRDRSPSASSESTSPLDVSGEHPTPEPTPPQLNCRMSEPSNSIKKELENVLAAKSLLEPARGEPSALAQLCDVAQINELLPRNVGPPSSSSLKISERTEKHIEMKVRELNLQPHHGALIKQLIMEKKNGLKERLQSEFSVKFKAALPRDSDSSLKGFGLKLNVDAIAQLKAKTKHLFNSTPTVLSSPTTTPTSKPAWKMVEEDWDSGEEVDDPLTVGSDKPNEIAVKLEKRRLSRTIETDINSIAETLVAQIKAGMPLPQIERTGSSTKERPVALGSFHIPKLEHLEMAGLDRFEELASLPQPMEGPVPGSDVRLERVNNVIRLYIKPTTCRLPNSLNIKVLNELTQALEYLESSTDTRVIVLVFPPLHEAMTAISDSENDPDLEIISGRVSLADRASLILENTVPEQSDHCYGIDLLSLCVDSPDARRQVASQTANAIKDLTHKLATCTRLVCTAVSGRAIGLSVVLLAYCDFVLADESATFSTPYAQLGYLPEAAAAHTLPHVIGRRKTSWLLLGNGTLSADEAEVCGLVTRVVPRRSHLALELNSLSRSLAATSLLASVSAKGMINHNIRLTIPNSLRTEVKILETHWSAPDTQHRMKSFAVQLLLDISSKQAKERETKSSDLDRTNDSMTPLEFEVPAQQLVFEEPSDNLGIDPLQPVDDIHFEDPTISLDLNSEGNDYEIHQLS